MIWPDPALWVIEVGVRAALRTQTRPRDLRWFRGLFPYDPFRENADVRKFEA